MFELLFGFVEDLVGLLDFWFVDFFAFDFFGLILGSKSSRFAMIDSSHALQR